jgi:hypothetical protein
MARVLLTRIPDQITEQTPASTNNHPKESSVFIRSLTQYAIKAPEIPRAQSCKLQMTPQSASVQWTLTINGTNHGPLLMKPNVINIVSAKKHALAKDPLMLSAMPLVQYNLLQSAFPPAGPHPPKSRRLTPELRAPVNISLEVRSDYMKQERDVLIQFSLPS